MLRCLTGALQVELPADGTNVVKSCTKASGEHARSVVTTGSKGAANDDDSDDVIHWITARGAWARARSLAPILQLAAEPGSESTVSFCKLLLRPHLLKRKSDAYLSITPVSLSLCPETAEVAWCC